MKVEVTNRGPSDADNAVFVVNAPRSTTFDRLPAATAQYCAHVSPTALRCTVDLAAGAGTPRLDFPITVDVSAGPYSSLGGGCVDLDGASGCGSGDDRIDPIVLNAPIDAHVAGTGSYAGPPDLGGVPRHNVPTSAAPSATGPNDNSDSGGDGTDNEAGGGVNNTAGGALPDAGQDLSGLLVLSVMLVVGGVAALLVARNRPRRRPAAGSF
jgi:hypothetical protein